MKELKLYSGGHPFGGSNLKFLNQQAQETALALVQGFVPFGTTAAVVFGCALTQDAGSTSIAEGWIYAVIGGAKKLLYVPAVTRPITGISNLFMRLNRAPADGYRNGVRYKDNSIKQVYFDETLEMVPEAVGLIGFPLTDLLFNVRSFEPVGAIRLWAPAVGNNYVDFFAPSGLGFGILTGWAVADGRNGTIDMRGMAPIGQGKGSYDANSTDYAIGAKVGTEKHGLTVEELPSHSHLDNAAEGYNRVLRKGQEGGGNVTPTGFNGQSTGGDENDILNYSEVRAMGANKLHENRQPSVAIVFYQKISN